MPKSPKQLANNIYQVSQLLIAQQKVHANILKESFLPKKF